MACPTKRPDPALHLILSSTKPGSDEYEQLEKKLRRSWGHGPRHSVNAAIDEILRDMKDALLSVHMCSSTLAF
jgi:hypothetical protein